MIEFMQWFFSVLAIYLLFFTFSLCVTAHQSKTVKYFVLIFTAVLIWLPLGQTPTYWYIRGFVGNLSIGSMMLCSVLILKMLFNINIVNSSSKNLFCYAVFISGLFLYPLSLGLSYFDPYILGFHHFYAEFVIAVIAVITVLKRVYFISIWLTLSYIFYQFHLFESDNLWDYLIDPVVFLFAMFFSLQAIKNKINKKSYVA